MQKMMFLAFINENCKRDILQAWYNRAEIAKIKDVIKYDAENDVFSFYYN